MSSPSQFAARKQDNLRGLAFMLADFLAFSCTDTLAKVLTSGYHPIQIVWLRQLGLTTRALVLLFLHGPGILRCVAPGLQVSRGLCTITSAVAFVFAFRYVMLADAVAVSLVAPFTVTILGMLVLRETVGPRRRSAVLAGFAGTLIVIRPGLGSFTRRSLW